MQKLALGLLIWGCFALKFPELLVLGFALCPLVLLASHVKGVSEPFVWVSLSIVYWAISGLLSGGIYLPDLGSTTYWAGEGRAFVSYVPLLCMLGWRMGPHMVPWAMRNLLLVALAGFCMAALWMLTKVEFLSGGSVGMFFGLQTSHTGAGMFWSTVCVLVIVYGFETKSKMYQVAGFMALLPMLGTASREALLGMAVAIGLWIVFKKGVRKYQVAGIVAVAFTGLMLFAGQTFIDRISLLMNPSGMSKIFTQTINSAGKAEGSSVEHDESGLYNIAMRFLLWKDALGKWTDSPVCGIGFGRFNDNVHRYSGIHHLCEFATDGKNNYQSEIETSTGDVITSTGNAHNTYFQTLAELGLPGLILLVGLWRSFWRRLGWVIRTSNRVLETGVGLSLQDTIFLRNYAAFAVALRAAIVSTAFGALVGDALMAPSSMLLMLPMLAVSEALRDRLRDTVAGAAAAADKATADVNGLLPVAKA